MAAIAVGDPIPPLGARKFYSAYLTPQAPARDVPLAAAPSLDELLSIPEVVWAAAICEKGSIPDWRQGTVGGALAHIFARSDSHERLLELAAEIASPKYFSFAEASVVGAAAG
jgi:hypothetical protein